MSADIFDFPRKPGAPDPAPDDLDYTRYKCQDLQWQCSCGCLLFYLQMDGVLCPNCGKYGPWEVFE